MTSTGRGGGGGGRGGGRGRGGGGRGRGGHGHGGRGRFGRGGRFIVGSPGFYNYGGYYPGYNWWSYYAAAQQQQAYLQYLQQLQAAYSQPQYAAVPGASMQVAQLRVAIDRLTKELADVQNALGAAVAQR